MKNDDHVNEEEIFQEEVSEEELCNKSEVDNHIYPLEKKGIYGSSLLTIFGMLLVFSFLFATFYGLLSLNSDLRKREIGVKVDEYHLKVIHTNYDYGGKIKSFANYTSSSKYFLYKFSVNNENAIDIDYSVLLQIKEKNKDLDLSLVNYTLLKNGVSVRSGNMTQADGKIYSTTILKKTIDEYEVRIWGDKSIKDLGLEFKTSVVV